jgi:hypothetical protein
VEECPHGLDVAWCSLCKARAQPPVAKPKPAPAARSRAARPVRSVPAEVSLDPSSALARLRPVLFHATAYGSWDSIAAHGLRTAAKLLSDDDKARTHVRTAPVEISGPDGLSASIRDQQVMARANIADHLDGITLGEWLSVLNERSFFFARQKDLTTLLGRYGSEGQDVLTFDTARLLAAVGPAVEVATTEVAAPVAWQKCPCRGLSTFEPLAHFVGDVADIQEVGIVGGIDDISRLVKRVVRHHGRGATPEVIVG